ncbi:protein DYAD [Trifolium pratense]|uniref:Protein DYAD n=3 Tax=Trifolium TaxID=3898 RepID=A0A2K3L9F2_TRIPR|nr:protein DYAD [Trifolium pratense]
MVLSSKSELRAAKIERLKSGFKICKPKGTFMWPNMSVSPNLLTNLDEHTMVPTPTSAFKLVTKSHTQNLSLLNPSSPIIKPLAARRTVSTATLTYVTGPFSPHLSPPLETPRSKITTTITKSSSSINLNESPLGRE